MRFPSPLRRGRVVQRYKRFFADILLDDGTEVTAHCPNPGAMTGLAIAGLEAWTSVSDNPKRKLSHTLELVRADGVLVGINTGHPNRIVAEALAARVLPQFEAYSGVRPEVRYGDGCRVDFLLTAPSRPDCYVEVKNVHLSRKPGLAEFPDSVTARGARHLEALAAMARSGHRAVLLYLVQRPDCTRLSLARDIDPAYARATDAARKAGVETLCYACSLSTTEITLASELEIA